MGPKAPADAAAERARAAPGLRERAMNTKTWGVAALTATMALGGAVLCARAQGPAARESQSELWRERLSASDLTQREEHFDALVRALSGDPTLREVVRGWSQGRDELAWTARLALRSAGEARGAARFDPFSGGGFPGFDPRARFDFAELDRLLEDLQSQFDLGSPTWPSSPGPPGAQAFGTSQSESFTFESGPDGVRITKEGRDADGNTTSDVYEADTLEELLAEHPELREHLQAFGARDFGFGAFPSLGGALGGRALAPLGGEQPGRGPRTDRLGVEVSALGPERAVGELDSGLLVVRVQPSSLAQALGLQQGDVIQSVQGRAVFAPADVAAALASRSDGAPIEVSIRSADGAERTLRWSPEEGAAAETRPLLEGPARRI